MTFSDLSAPDMEMVRAFAAIAHRSCATLGWDRVAPALAECWNIYSGPSGLQWEEVSGLLHEACCNETKEARFESTMLAHCQPHRGREHQLGRIQ